MKRSRAPWTRSLLWGATLPLWAGVGLSFLFRHPEVGSYDLAKDSILTLSPKTKETLASLDAPVKITYYVTEKRRMPTPFRSMERDVRALARQMSRWAPRGFTLDVVHPEDSPQEVRGLGRFRISSFQYKTILKDEYTVSTVWSGALLEYKGKSRAIPYLTPNHLPHLEDQWTTHLRQINVNYMPSVAVRTSRPNGLIQDTLNKIEFGGTVVPWAEGSPLPMEADLVFLLQPPPLSPDDVEALERFIGDGKNVFVALSPYQSRQEGDRLFVVPFKSGLEKFFERRGVSIPPRLLLSDTSSNGRPFDLILGQSLANLEGFVLTAQGTMIFPQAGTIDLNPPKGKENGYFSRSLLIGPSPSWTAGFSTDNGTIFDLSSLRVPPAGSAKNETIGVAVNSDKPWEGTLFLFSSGQLWDDASAQAMGSNGLYLKNLLMTFAKSERLTSIKASQKLKPTVPPLSTRERLFWRLWGMGVVPFAIAALALRPRSGGSASPLHHRRGMLRWGGTILAGLAGVLAFGHTERYQRWPSADMTRYGEHTLARPTLEKIKALTEDVDIRYFTSPLSSLPLPLKRVVRRTRDTLEQMARTNPRRVRFEQREVPDPVPQDTQEWLNRYRLNPFVTQIIEQDRYTEKKIYSSLAFETGGRAEVVGKFTPQNADRLEFLVVGGLLRLSTGHRPSVGLMVDLPHMTPGEFWELEQLNVKIMPQSEDVYAQLIDLLRNEGYAVRLYDSKKETPAGEDVLLYVQPWTITPAVREAMAKKLQSGGAALVAVQHYRMQERKYPGLAYASAFWPQPQFTRVNELLAPYGVELIQEVFLDQSKAPTESREQINWGAYRKENKRAPGAQPFLIRAIPENFAKDSPITARLSDLLLIWPNRWRKVPGSFPASLRWHPLVSSSKDSWSIDWKGGFLSPDDLKEGNYFDVSQPMAVELEGMFPPGEGGSVPESQRAPGRLVLLGCSEILSNEPLSTQVFDNQKFILNAVADLSYGPDLAWIQARGGPDSQGFPFVPPLKKLMWRLIVMGLTPALFALVALWMRAGWPVFSRR